MSMPLWSGRYCLQAFFAAPAAFRALLPNARRDKTFSVYSQ